MQHELTRRKFLQTSAVAGFSLLFGAPGTLLRVSRASAALREASDSPLTQVRGPFVSGVFNGDDVNRPHNILWDKDHYIQDKGGRPTTFTREKVVIVGGGMSGLLTAYQLRDLNPLVLEQDPRFGGNSKGEIFQDGAFSIGAAYITSPEEGGDVEKFLKELGLLGALRKETDDDSRVFFKGQGFKSLWKGETGAAESAKEVQTELERIYKEAYPSIPWTKDSALSLQDFQKLDRTSAQEWLRSRFPRLHPHVEEFFQLYCWSSLGGSLEELSAAQFLNFVAAETVGVSALPGGNAAIAAALHAKLPSDRMRSGCIAIEIKNTSDGVEILFEDKDGTLRIIRAQAVVVAAPKYVARFIVSGINNQRDEAWKNLNFRAYVVANVHLKTPVTPTAFDCFALEGSVPDAPSFGHRTDRAFADFVFAGWARRDSGTSILTLYKPYPFDGARSLLTSDTAFDRIKGQLEATLPKMFPAMGIDPNALDGIRLTRWGHAIPLAAIGFASGPDFATVSAPEGKIFFANQDNLMNPAFESCLSAAQDAATAIRAAL